MNKDQIKGLGKDMAGKTQEAGGRIMGDRSEQAKGLGKQAAGKVQKGYGDAKETLRNTTRKNP